MFAIFLYVNYIAEKEKETIVGVPCEYSATLRNAFARGHQYYYEHPLDKDPTETKVVIFRRLDEIGFERLKVLYYIVLYKAHHKMGVKIIQSIEKSLDVFNSYNEGWITPHGTDNRFPK